MAADIKEAFQEAGATIAKTTLLKRSRRERQEEWKWGQIANKSTIEWENPQFGSIQIAVRNRSLGKATQIGSSVWAPIYLNGKEPDALDIEFTGRLAKDTTLLYAVGEEITDMLLKDGFPPFKVNIDWKEGKHDSMPHVRKTHADNVDFIFLRRGGRFIELQVSVVTRKGDFWLCVQLQFQGQVARTLEQKAKELGITGVQMDDGYYVGAPLSPKNAFKGADYAKNFPPGKNFLEYAASKGAYMKLSDVKIPYWEQDLLEMPEWMANGGWVRATVMFYNLVLGWGFVLCEDETPCFVHFNSFVDEDGKPANRSGMFAALEPMEGIALKYKVDPKRGRQATMVRSLSF